MGTFRVCCIEQRYILWEISIKDPFKKWILFFSKVLLASKCFWFTTFTKWVVKHIRLAIFWYNCFWAIGHQSDKNCTYFGFYQLLSKKLNDVSSLSWQTTIIF